jgi:hypothetical protein
MENKKRTYEEVINFLKNTSPILNSPEDLTQTITRNIETIAGNSRKWKTIRLTGIVSGIVACLFCCWLVYDGIQLPVYQVDETKVSIKLFSKEITSDIFNAKQPATVDDVSSGKRKIAEMIKDKSERRNRKIRIYKALYNQSNHSIINL